MQLIEELSELGCSEVCILGGEPFLVPFWMDVAKHVCECGMDLVIITNGWCVDRSLVGKLKKLKGLDRIGVSLDGSNHEVHDFIRGRRGAFEKALKALYLLRDEGFEAGAITSVSRLNLSELSGLRDLLIDQDITWQIQSVIGHGRRWSESWNLSPQQHYQIAEFISQSRNIIGAKRLPVTGSHCFGYFSQRLTNYTEVGMWPGCAAGIATLGICSSGLVKPCLSQPDAKIIGDLRQECLKSIWEDDSRFQRTRGFHIDMLEGFCRQCPHALICKGGCPNLSMASTGSDADNPFCCYRMEMEGRVPQNPLEKGWITKDVILR